MLYRWANEGVVVYRSWLLDELGVPHAFGTRQGDDQAIAAAIGLAGRLLVTVRQVHGHTVHQEDQAPVSDTLPRCDADAVVLTRPDAVTRILTADCVPILFASTDGKAVAATHAGWRGLLSGVIEQTVDTLASPFIAAIGPCISVNRFEVGEEVAEQFDPRFVRRGLGSRPHVDLRAAVYEALQRLGAKEIDTTDRCTAHHEEEFFSHRRDVTHRGDETTGRMASVIALPV